MFQSPVFIMIFRFCAKVEMQPLSLMWPVGGTILENKGTDQARRTANFSQSHSTMQMPQQPYEDTMNYSPFELFCCFFSQFAKLHYSHKQLFYKILSIREMQRQIG